MSALVSQPYYRFCHYVLCIFAAEAEIQSPNFDAPEVNVTATSGTIAILPCTISYVGDKTVCIIII